MLVAFSWEIRPYLHEFREGARLSVLVSLMLRANIRMRCWPSMETIARDTGYAIATVSEAKQWLNGLGAIMLVPYAQRVDEEKALPVRQHVYQLTGAIKMQEKIIPYLVMGDEAQKAVNIILGEISPTEISLDEIIPTESKVSTISKVSSKRKVSSSKRLGSPKVEPIVDTENTDKTQYDAYAIPVINKNGDRINSFQYVVGGINIHIFKGKNLGQAKKFASVLKENGYAPTGAEMQGYPVWYAALPMIDGEPREPIQSHLKFPTSWGEYIEWRKQNPDKAPEAAAPPTATPNGTLARQVNDTTVLIINSSVFEQVVDTYYDE